MELDHGPHGRALLPGPLAPVVFSGDWATLGRLLGGPCRDFNVMSRREEVLHNVTIMQVGPTPSPLPEAPVLLVYCARGAASLVPDAGRVRAGELLRVDGEGVSGLTVAAAEGTAALVVVAIRPRQMSK